MFFVRYHNNHINLIIILIFNRHPSLSCQCKEGFGGNGNNCQDQNECQVSDHWLDVGGHNCSENATCNNIAGGFECVCNSGYIGDGVTCQDIDECVTDACGANTICQNSIGSFSRGLRKKLQTLKRSQTRS